MDDRKLITPASLLRQVRASLFDVSAQTRRYVEANVGAISCRPGCSGCCTQKVVVTAADGVVLYLYLKANRLLTPDLLSRLEASEAGMSAVTHGDWLAQGKPCALLKGGSCVAYPARPMACAVTYSVGDPQLCSAPGLPGQFTVTDDAGGAIQRHGLLTVALERGLHEDARRGLFMTLPGAVLWARALLEGLPDPGVRRVRGIDHRDVVEVLAAFDAVGVTSPA